VSEQDKEGPLDGSTAPPEVWRKRAAARTGWVVSWRAPVPGHRRGFGSGRIERRNTVHFVQSTQGSRGSKGLPARASSALPLGFNPSACASSPRCKAGVKGTLVGFGLPVSGGWRAPLCIRFAARPEIQTVREDGRQPGHCGSARPVSGRSFRRELPTRQLEEAVNRSGGQFCPRGGPFSVALPPFLRRWRYPRQPVRLAPE
jgi:hypothetical protein